MHEKLNVFYYPSPVLPETTLKRAMLLFDELHVLHHPSDESWAHSGFMYSPLLGYDKTLLRGLREQGFPLYVHQAPEVERRRGASGQIEADVNDPKFLRRFQRGLKTSKAFAKVNVKTSVFGPGIYGGEGTHDEVVRKLTTVDLESALTLYESPIALLQDLRIPPGNSSNLQCARNLIFQASGCSTRMNTP
jgi:hypothetical protein